ncbi:MAG: hypothetical protein EOM91_13295 [Sphingobacteriia bacterium]|nr:hypothetical protein [Sphingobacteriia bacterium]NCC40887.1 hypothetical protein [Gammaproteobacteria bacterium]
MTTLLERESELEFELGGPAYRLMQRIGLIQGAGPSLGRRIVGFLLITWVPLLILALIEGRALGPTPRESLLLDLATYARFFLAVPLIFIAEVVVGPRLRNAGLHFIRGDLIRPEDLPAVEAAITRVQRRREALLPELIILGLAVVGAWSFTIETLAGESAITWRFIMYPDGMGLSLAGYWYQFIGVPLLQFFMYRWLWRLIIWTLFLRDMSRLPLRLVATHPDRAGGLGFLGGAHLSLAIFPFAFSCVLSAHVAFQVYFEAVPIETFKALFVVYLVLMELICLGPLLLFVPLLARARRAGLLEYSILLSTHNQAFEQKWIRDQHPSDQATLGSPDNSSLADLGASFGMIRDMKPFPFTRQQILQIAVIASLPGLPLIFLVMPVGELLKLLAGALL